jgi:hypothetical protein
MKTLIIRPQLLLFLVKLGDTIMVLLLLKHIIAPHILV